MDWFEGTDELEEGGVCSVAFGLRAECRIEGELFVCIEFD